MKKKDLFVAVGISGDIMAKLGRDENVNAEELVKTCNTLGCDIEILWK